MHGQVFIIEIHKFYVFLSISSISESRYNLNKLWNLNKIQFLWRHLPGGPLSPGNPRSPMCPLSPLGPDKPGSPGIPERPYNKLALSSNQMISIQ